MTRSPAAPGEGRHRARRGARVAGPHLPIGPGLGQTPHGSPRRTQALHAALEIFRAVEDDAFVKLIDAFTKATGVKVDIAPRILRGRAAKASVAANTGAARPVWGLYSLPHLFPQKCLDVSDVADYLGKKYGGWVPSAVTYGRSGNKWIAVPICYSAT